MCLYVCIYAHTIHRIEDAGFTGLQGLEGFGAERFCTVSGLEHEARAEQPFFCRQKTLDWSGSKGFARFVCISYEKPHIWAL